MATVEEKKDLSENVATKESGCCGGSKEAAKVEEKKGEACATKPLDVKVEKKDKEHGTSCCG